MLEGTLLDSDNCGVFGVEETTPVKPSGTPEGILVSASDFERAQEAPVLCRKYSRLFRGTIGSTLGVVFSLGNGRHSFVVCLLCSLETPNVC